MISQEIVRELLDYDPETGKLTWRRRDKKWFKSDKDCAGWNTRYSNKEAFITLNSQEYFCGAILKKNQYAHRIIWLWMTGEWPEEIDHINHDRKDNKWLNLREVSHKENNRNQSRNKNNTSGCSGVCFDKRDNKWRAYISANINIGSFVSLEEAVSARKAAEIKYGFHENHGNPMIRKEKVT